jgi:hypothetical protein
MVQVCYYAGLPVGGSPMNGFLKGLLAFAAFLGFVFAMTWLAGPPKEITLRTGDNCVEIVDRLFEIRKSHVPTAAEQADLGQCEEAFRQRQ